MGWIFCCQKLDPVETTYLPVSLNSMQCEVTVKWWGWSLGAKKNWGNGCESSNHKKNIHGIFILIRPFLSFSFWTIHLYHISYARNYRPEGVFESYESRKKDIIDREHARHQYQVLVINKKKQKTLYQRYSKHVNCFCSKACYIIIMNPTFLGDVWIFNWVVSISSFLRTLLAGWKWCEDYIQEGDRIRIFGASLDHWNPPTTAGI